MTWIEDARAKEQAATPGRWGVASASSQAGPWDFTVYTDDDEVEDQRGTSDVAWFDGNVSVHDAMFIAWARNVMPAMLDALEAADELRWNPSFQAQVTYDAKLDIVRDRLGGEG